MKLYIAGPMTGYPNYNFPAFDAAAETLRRQGHTVISPTDLDRERGYVTEVDGVVETTPLFSLEAALEMDFRAIIDTHGIVLLPGWENSVGARKERRVAEDLGRKIFHYVHGGIVEERVWLIGLTGYARVGKDTVGRFLTEDHGFERLAFADGVREGAYNMNPVIGVGDLGQSIRLRHVVDACGWEEAKKEPEVRRFLQVYGTEGGRNIFGESCWIDRTLGRALPFRAYVVTDVRYPNEAEAVRARGGEVWRVTRPGHGPVNSHSSDNALDEIEPDAWIINDGTLEDLERSVNLRMNTFDLRHGSI